MKRSYVFILHARLFFLPLTRRILVGLTGGKRPEVWWKTLSESENVHFWQI